MATKPNSRKPRPAEETAFEKGAGGEAPNGTAENFQQYGNGDSGRTKEQIAKLFPTSQIKDIGDAYCPNPNIDDLSLGYETLVTAIQRHPEMRTVEKTDVIKEVHYEDQTVLVPKMHVVTDKIKHVDQIAIVRQVPKTRIKTVYRVVQEEVEVTEMVDIVEYIDVPRYEEVSRYIVENVEEKVSVPVLRDVSVTSTVEVPTKNYCEAQVAELKSPIPFKLIEARHKPTPFPPSFNLIEGLKLHYDDFKGNGQVATQA